jgi:hypothetical protein
MTSKNMVQTARIRAKQRHLVVMLLLCLAYIGLIGASPAMPLATNDWRVGNDVGLSRGTQIRVGPGTGFCYHTVVPEDNWTVRIIGGPRKDDKERLWYDTSRAAAGDPSGGTGWVRQGQADTSPAPDDGGVYCPPDSGIVPPPATPIPGVVIPRSTPTPGPKDVCEGLSVHLPGFIYEGQSWWVSQSMVIKIVILIIALVLFFLVERWTMNPEAILPGLIRMILAGILLAGMGDLLRSYWIAMWYQITQEKCGIEPTILLLIGPLTVWGVARLFGTVSRLLGIIVIILLVVLLVILLTPERISGIVDGVRHLFGFVSMPG